MNVNVLIATTTAKKEISSGVSKPHLSCFLTTAMDIKIPAEGI